ncbi:hypothetical protein BTS2_0521 [Bacillus sp. TS-2]|nr:hypothetical protein BTS2_0521 [Bacillus sp. TS-2]
MKNNKIMIKVDRSKEEGKVQRQLDYALFLLAKQGGKIYLTKEGKRHLKSWERSSL